MTTARNTVDVLHPAIDAVCPDCGQRVIVGESTQGRRVLVDAGASCLGIGRAGPGRLFDSYWAADVHDCRGRRG